MVETIDANEGGGASGKMVSLSDTSQLHVNDMASHEMGGIELG